MISTETGEARLASARDAVSRHMIGPHLGDQEYAVALTSDRAADQFLGAVRLPPCRSASSRAKGRCAALLPQQLEDVFPFRDPQSPGRAPGRLCRRETLPYAAPVEAAPVAASRADAPDGVTNEPSATQSPLNSRRFSNAHILSSLDLSSHPRLFPARDEAMAAAELPPGRALAEVTGPNEHRRRRRRGPLCCFAVN